MAELQRHAQRLAELNFSFQQHVQTRHKDGPWPRIVAYRETQLFKGALVVQPDSANPRIADAEVVDLPFNHQTICKHQTRSAAPYEWLLKQLAVAQRPLQRAAPAQGVVFVSYLRAADATTSSDAAVYELVAWLRGQGVQLVVDIDHFGQRIPVGGWTQWTGRCTEQAQTVLLIDHAAYPAAFEGQQTLPDAAENPADPANAASPSFGRAVVTRIHYQRHAACRDKFIPLLKDGDPMSYLPNALHDWWNGLRFPSGRMAILEAIAAPTRAAQHTQATP